MSVVLIVDNDSSLRQMLELAFRSQDLATIATGCPQRAAAEIQSGKVGAMLLDYHLGAGVSGAILLQEWLSYGPLPPFWLVTGMPDDPEVLAAAELDGCQGITPKPFAVMRLVATVSAVLEPPEREAEA